MGKNLTGQISALAVGIAGMAVFTAAVPAGAQTIYFGGSSGPYAGNVVFSFSSGQMTLQINNTNNASPQSDSNAIIGVGFDLTGSPSLSVDTSATVGPEITITSSNGHGPPQYSASESSPKTEGDIKNPWTLASNFNNDSYYLGEITGGQPHDLVINTPALSPNFANVNGSMVALTPSLASGATFELTSIGITSTTTASDLEVYFSTGRGTGGLPNTIPVPNPFPAGAMPIPATLPLTAAGGLGLLAFALRKRKATF